MRKEFNVDDSRTYLMGHSMGGAGTYFLGSKHAKEILQGIKDGNVPMLVTTGDAGEAVPVANTRMWVETMKALGMSHEYQEYPGVTHGPTIEAAMPDIFAFFEAHAKRARN